ncbi:MAG TPA: tetratricopeptide repeat protein [Reyranella sp.]|jgi:tetratricopeptide (TPR) repeat protein|nr:tetratricopeptide repeat protein [Reyranella sp.]
MRFALAICALALLMAAPMAPPAEGQTTETREQQIERIKRENAKIDEENKLIQQANAALGAKNWHAAVEPLQKLIALDGDNWQYYTLLGDAEFNLAHYDRAADVLKKGVRAAERSKTGDNAKRKAGEARMLVTLGNASLKLHDTRAAVDAYTRAASLAPDPALAYFNLCATQYNAGNKQAALAACDKAIAADPRKADAYFIKGSALVGGSRVENGKVVAPPGTVETLRKYLELEPNGLHAKDAKELLAYVSGKPK